MSKKDIRIVLKFTIYSEICNCLNGGEIVNKKMFTALTILLMVFVGLQFATPVSAVKLVDHGTKYSWDGQNGWTKATWSTYQYRYKNGKINNNFIITYVKHYAKVGGKYLFSYHEKITIAKVTKSTVKITDWTDNELCPGTTKYYAKTKLTAARYYWRVYRSNIWNF